MDHRQTILRLRREKSFRMEQYFSDALKAQNELMFLLRREKQIRTSRDRYTSDSRKRSDARALQAWDTSYGKGEG